MTWLMNIYFFLLGFALGLIIQVLVIAVQNTASYADLGEAMGGAPPSRTSAQEVERVLSRLSASDLRRFGYAKLARAAGLDLPGGACWILTMLAKQGATPGPELARQAGVTMAEGHPNAQLLVDQGLITRTDGVLALTPPGAETAERLFAAKRDWLQHQLAGWSPQQHAELEQVCGFVDMETLIWQLVDRFVPACERCGQYHPHHRPDLITRVTDLVMVSGTCHLDLADNTADQIDLPSGRHPVYVGTFEVGSPGGGPDRHVASMLFVALAEPEGIAGAQHWIEDDTSVPLPVPDYVVLSDVEARRLPVDPIGGSHPMRVFLRDVEGRARAGQFGAPSQWPSRVLDDESGLNVLALPMAGEFLRSVRGGDDEEMLAVMYLSYSY